MDDAFKSTLIIPLAGLLIMGIIANLLLYWGVICRTLYKFGARFPTGLAFWRMPEELKAFRDISATHGKSMATYAAFLILLWFNVIMMVVLLLRILWESTGPHS